MSSLRNMRHEFSLLTASPLKFFVPIAAALVCGLFTWLSCDGVTVVWKTSFQPAFSLPLGVLFALWIAAYVLFGFVISVGFSCSAGSELCMKAVIAYFAALFWCPLTLLAGVGICGICALAVSALYLTYIIKIFSGFSIIGTISSLLIIVFEIYLVYFTVGFTIIN